MPEPSPNLTPHELDDAARRLDEAERTRRAITQLSAAYPAMTVDDAYAVQRTWVAAKIASGERVIGRKVGLTSKAMQRLVNIDEPDHGVLLDRMAIADGEVIPGDRFITPRVEIELAFILAEPLSGPNCSVHDVLRATEYVVPSLEIIDARILRVDPETGRTRTVIDTISDNAANAGIVLGGSPVRPNDIDLRWQGGLLYRNGVIEESGLAASVLGHPARGLAWLANRLHAYGERLEAGHVVLSGAFAAAVDARPGDQFHADFGRLGSVGVTFGSLA